MKIISNLVEHNKNFLIEFNDIYTEILEKLNSDHTPHDDRHTLMLLQ